MICLSVSLHHKFSPILVTATCQQARSSISPGPKDIKGPYIASPQPYPLPFCFPSWISSSPRCAPAHIHHIPTQPVTLHKPQGWGLLASGGISLSIPRTREAHVGWQGHRAAPVASWGELEIALAAGTNDRCGGGGCGHCWRSCFCMHCCPLCSR